MLTERTLDQILEVLARTVENFHAGHAVPKAYQKAVKGVAADYSVRYQTIADGCRRRLNLKNINNFIGLLDDWLSGSPKKLIETLEQNVSETDHYKIRRFFKEVPYETLGEEVNGDGENKKTISLSIEAKYFSQLKLISQDRSMSIQQILEPIINEFINRQFLEYFKKQFNSFSDQEKETFINLITKG